MEKKDIKYFIISIVLIFIDQISKILVNNFLLYNVNYKVINKFLYFTYNHNYGAGFGILQNKRVLLIIFAFGILIYLIYEFLFSSKTKLSKISYSLMIGGLIGNLIDRLMYGYVRDFIDIRIWNYKYPIFNISDSCLVVGVCLLIISLIKEEMNEKNKNKRRK